MLYFTEFYIYENSRKRTQTVVVYKKGNRHCMDITDLESLEDNLQYLNSTQTSGWAFDIDVGELVSTYTIETHPEYFI